MSLEFTLPETQATEGLHCIDFTQFINMMQDPSISEVINSLSVLDETAPDYLERLDGIKAVCCRLPAFQILCNEFEAMRNISAEVVLTKTPVMFALASYTKKSDEDLVISSTAKKWSGDFWLFPKSRQRFFLSNNHTEREFANNRRRYNYDLKEITNIKPVVSDLFLNLFPDQTFSLVKNHQQISLIPNLNFFKKHRKATEKEDAVIFQIANETIQISKIVQKYLPPTKSTIYGMDLGYDITPRTISVSSLFPNNNFYHTRILCKIKSITPAQLQRAEMEKALKTPKFDGVLKYLIFEYGKLFICNSKIHLKNKLSGVCSLKVELSAKCDWYGRKLIIEAEKMENSMHFICLRLLCYKGVCLPYTMSDLDSLSVIQEDFVFSSIMKEKNNPKKWPTDGFIYHLFPEGLYQQHYAKSEPTHDLDHETAEAIMQTPIEPFEGIMEFSYNVEMKSLSEIKPREDKTISDKAVDFSLKNNTAIEMKFIATEVCRHRYITTSSLSQLFPSLEEFSLTRKTYNLTKSKGLLELMDNDTKLFLVGLNPEFTLIASVDLVDTFEQVKLKYSYGCSKEKETDGTFVNGVKISTYAIAPIMIKILHEFLVFRVRHDIGLFVAEAATVLTFWRKILVTIQDLEFIGDLNAPRKGRLNLHDFDFADLCAGTGALSAPLNFRYQAPKRIDLVPDPSNHVECADARDFRVGTNCIAIMAGNWKDVQVELEIALLNKNIFIATPNSLPFKKIETMNWITPTYTQRDTNIFFKLTDICNGRHDVTMSELNIDLKCDELKMGNFPKRTVRFA